VLEVYSLSAAGGKGSRTSPENHPSGNGYRKNGGMDINSRQKVVNGGAGIIEKHEHPPKG
jgi:hypothetical protein